jgi:hypothetical protein
MSNMSADDSVPMGVIGLGMMGRPMASASGKSSSVRELRRRRADDEAQEGGDAMSFGSVVHPKY